MPATVARRARSHKEVRRARSHATRTSLWERALRATADFAVGARPARDGGGEGAPPPMNDNAAGLSRAHIRGARRWN